MQMGDSDQEEADSDAPGPAAADGHLHSMPLHNSRNYDDDDDDEEEEEEAGRRRPELAPSSRPSRKLDLGDHVDADLYGLRRSVSMALKSRVP